MCFSVFLALVLGAYCFLTSAAMLVHREYYRKVVSEFLSSSPLLFWSGAMSLFFGLLIVVSHNIWVGHWRILITLIGWCLVTKGLFRLFFPSHFSKMAKNLINGRGYVVTLSIWLLVGFYLLWMGLGL